MRSEAAGDFCVQGDLRGGSPGLQDLPAQAQPAMDREARGSCLRSVSPPPGDAEDDCNSPGSSFHGIFHARILEGTAISSSSGWSLVKHLPRVLPACLLCLALAGRVFTIEPPVLPVNTQSLFLPFRTDWFDLVQGTLKSLLQHHGSKASF